MSRPIDNSNITIKSSKDVANLLMQELRYEKREMVKLLVLNAKNVVIKIVDIAYGGTNFAVLEPKEILLELIEFKSIFSIPGINGIKKAEIKNKIKNEIIETIHVDLKKLLDIKPPILVAPII